jgi:hypothetical protein
MLCLSYYLLCFLFNKIGEEKNRAGSAWKQGGRLEGWGREEDRRQGGEVAQTVYTHLNKYRNKK